MDDHAEPGDLTGSSSHPRRRTAVVREATVEDAAALAAFVLAAWRDAGPDSPGFAGASPDVIAEIATPAAMRARIGPGGRRMFLAEDRSSAAPGSGPVVAFAATRPLDERTVELAGIVVARAAEGQGIGSQLVRLATAAATGDGFERMIVRTERSNEHAIGFYQGRGFEIAGEDVETVGPVDVPVVELAMTVAMNRGPEG